MRIDDIIQGLKEIYTICCSVFAYDRKNYIDEAIYKLHKYQLMQADYENRLKPYIVDMLEDLKKEMNPIKECEHQIYGKEEWNFVGKCQDVIQQKIDALKSESEEEDGNN